MKCIYCGKRIRKSDYFCPHCGMPQSDDAAGKNTGAAGGAGTGDIPPESWHYDDGYDVSYGNGENETSGNSLYINEENDENTGKKKKKKKKGSGNGPIILLAAVLAFIVVMGGYFLFALHTTGSLPHFRSVTSGESAEQESSASGTEESSADEENSDSQPADTDSGNTDEDADSGEEDTETVTDAVTMYVSSSTGGVNVRSGRGTQYQQTGRLTNGTKVSVGNLKGGWYQIASGTYAGNYVAASMLSQNESGSSQSSTASQADAKTVTVSGAHGYARVRSGRGTGYRDVVHLPGGTKIQVTNLQNGWYQIASGPYAGYYISSTTVY